MTFLLDTNVLSELRKRRPAKGVVSWVQQTAGDEKYVSVLALGEIRQGVERLRCRDQVQAGALDEWLADLEARFSDRILAVDKAVAHAWGRLSATDPVSPVDCLMAATALVHGLVVVTRDTAPFERVGVPCLDPWAYGQP